MDCDFLVLPADGRQRIAHLTWRIATILHVAEPQLPEISPPTLETVVIENGADLMTPRRDGFRRSTGAEVDVGLRGAHFARRTLRPVPRSITAVLRIAEAELSRSLPRETVTSALGSMI